MIASARMLSMNGPRKLQDLIGIGRAMMEDFELLGVRSVEQLSVEDPQQLYDRLCAIRKRKMDPCVLDTFRCAVEQALDPDLPSDKRHWWYWSRVRKAKAARGSAC